MLTGKQYILVVFQLRYHAAVWNLPNDIIHIHLGLWKLMGLGDLKWVFQELRKITSSGDNSVVLIILIPMK